jgi:ketosteroid isomerase-like protein
MRNLFRISTVLLGLGALQGCTASPRAAVVPPPVPPLGPPAPTPTGGSVPVPLLLRPTHDGYVAAWNGEDPAAVGAFFTDDAHAVIGDSVFHGRARIVSGLTPDLTRLSMIDARPERFSAAGDQITETGRYSLRQSPPAVATRMRRGTYTHVWARQPDGSWRITTATVTLQPFP